VSANPASEKVVVMVQSRKPTVPVAIRRALADTEFTRRVVIRALQQGARLRRPRVGDRVLLNSFPKAGTHLAARALDLSQLVRYSWRHLAPKELPDECDDGRNQRVEGTARELQRVPPGHYATAHVSYSSAIHEGLTTAAFGIVLVVRDPRALLVSNVRYILSRRRHFLHERFARLYRTDEERIRALLDGFETSRQWGLGRAPFSDLLAAYIPWLDACTVCIRFEDLAGPRAGGTRQAQLEALSNLYSVIHNTNPRGLADRLADEIWSRQSVTFRSGQIDAWRHELPRSLVGEVETRLAPVASQLGYDFYPAG
jgi:hypothetical protein